MTGVLKEGEGNSGLARSAKVASVGECTERLQGRYHGLSHLSKRCKNIDYFN